MKKPNLNEEKKVTDSKKKKSVEVTNWDKTVGEFAEAIGINLIQANTKLQDLVGLPGDEALALLLNEEDCTTVEIKEALQGVPKAKLNKAIRTILRVEEVVSETAKTEGETSSVMAPLDILPSELSEVNLLDTLKTGGVLRVNSATVTMVMRAALASRTGVFGVRKTLVDKMEAHAESLDEPVGEKFFKLRNELTRRNYGEIFSAIEGSVGQFVTQGRIKMLLGKLNNDLWPAMYSFHEQVNGWVQSWQQGAANPAAMMVALTAIMGNKGGVMAPGIMAPPPTDTLRDAAEGVVDKINRVFSGTGTVVASALGYDAKTLMDILNDDSLPAQIGAANKEQMLKLLGVNVTADVSRMSTNAARYLLSIMELPKVAAGNEELAYITALFQLGSAIPWDQLKGGGKSGIVSQL
jgi:hypothetical protein